MTAVPPSELIQGWRRTVVEALGLLFAAAMYSMTEAHYNSVYMVPEANLGESVKLLMFRRIWWIGERIAGKGRLSSHPGTDLAFLSLNSHQLLPILAHYALAMRC
jgi:hypothetical protein